MVTAKKAYENAIVKEKEREEMELASFLKEINEKIERDTLGGYYSTTIEITIKNPNVVSRAQKILEKAGYKVSFIDISALVPFRDMKISWDFRLSR